MIDVLPEAARVIVGVVLMAAGIGKLRSRAWPSLAAEMGTPKLVVLCLPAAEAMLGLALVLQIGGRQLSWLAVVMFMVFTAVIVARYRQGSDLPCNCFGGGKGLITRVT